MSLEESTWNLLELWRRKEQADHGIPGLHCENRLWSKALDDGRVSPGSGVQENLRRHSSISPYPPPQAPEAQTSKCPPTLGLEFGEKEIILESSVKKRRQN